VRTKVPDDGSPRARDDDSLKSGEKEARRVTTRSAKHLNESTVPRLIYLTWCPSYESFNADGVPTSLKASDVVAR
jgi:hypothetical protein